ncbi:tigger transposable element-derived protein 4-like [Anthonomus grandis grandis]|uniref:tigger transposable element-derived protein 4-like n=1 Tax=Anthonomus grandis grandis TaxID=2921223 RepID=UPI0021661E57|nr:tigger transposable element-derived protein 4-like [Anthonomus grandis grandis]
MVGSSMSGTEKLRLLIIGKSKNPRCFKGIKSFAVDYEYNKKAWMTSEIYEKWLLKPDKKFAAQRRKVLLFVDNCPAHPKSVESKLKNIKLEYFPPNLTSILQPMDQGIIKNLKQHYRNRIVMKVLAHMEVATPTTVALLDAIQDLNKTWTLDVKEQTIANCFRKAGFVKDKVQQDADNWDEDDLVPLSELKTLWTSYRRAIDMSDVSFEDYVTIDDNVQITGFPTDEEILESVIENLVPNKKDPEENEDDGQSEGETVPTPAIDETISAIEKIRCFILSRENIPYEIHNSLNLLEDFIDKEKWTNFTPKKITDFFKKNL